MRLGVSRIAVAAAIVVVSGAPALAQEAPTEAVLVTYTSEAGVDRATAEGGPLDEADAGAEEIAGRVAAAELTPAEVADVADDPGVVAVEPDGEVFAADVPNDPCYAAPATCLPQGAWHVDQIGLPSAWDISHGSGVVIAVVDGGVDEVNPVADLAGKLVGEIDVTGDKPECTSTSPGTSSHATNVAALAAAATNNGVRIPGAGWDAQVLSVQALGIGPSGRCGGSESDVIAGITAAVNHGARVVNLSLTTRSLSSAMRVTIDSAIAHGVVVVGAAGNDNQANPSTGSLDGSGGGYPAAYPPVIAVGMTTRLYARDLNSNYGPWVDVYAPGSGLQDSQGQAAIIGTSFAAPLVSGVAALMLAVRPSLTPADVSLLLTRTSDFLGGTGLNLEHPVFQVDAREALNDTVFNAGAVPGLGAAALATGPGVIEVFSGTNVGSPWNRTIGGATTRWTSLDGLVVGDPDAASAGSGRIDLVARGIDNVAYHQFRIGSGPWSGWQPLGTGRFTSALTVTSPAPGQLVFFGRGLDGAIWTARLDNGALSGWSTLGGGFNSEPDAVSFGGGQLGVFAVGQDGAMWGRTWSGTWTPWFSLGGALTSGPGVASWQANRIDLVARGLDGAIFHRAWNGSGWAPWSGLGGFVTSAPDLATRGPGVLDVLARAPDSQLWRRTFSGGVWGSWSPAG